MPSPPRVGCFVFGEANKNCRGGRKRRNEREEEKGGNEDGTKGRLGRGKGRHEKGEEERREGKERERKSYREEEGDVRGEPSNTKGPKPRLARSGRKDARRVEGRWAAGGGRRAVQASPRRV